MNGGGVIIGTLKARLYIKGLMRRCNIAMSAAEIVLAVFGGLVALFGGVYVSRRLKCRCTKTGCACDAEMEKNDGLNNVNTISINVDNSTATPTVAPHSSGMITHGSAGHISESFPMTNTALGQVPDAHVTSHVRIDPLGHWMHCENNMFDIVGTKKILGFGWVNTINWNDASSFLFDYMMAIRDSQSFCKAVRFNKTCCIFEMQPSQARDMMTGYVGQVTVVSQERFAQVMIPPHTPTIPPEARTRRVSSHSSTRPSPAGQDVLID